MKICLIDVAPSHYREEIYHKMAETFDVDYYFGKLMPSIKKLDCSLLKGFKKQFETKYIGRFYYFKNFQDLLKLDYTSYILDGDFRCLSSWIFMLRAKFTEKKVYLWTHAWYGRENYFKKIIKKLFFSLTDGIFVYGDYAKNLMIQEGISQNKLFVIHNSLAFDRQLKLRKDIKESSVYYDHFGNNNPNLFFIGRLTLVKKLDLAVEALKIMKEKGIMMNLTFIGDGPVKEDLAKFAVSLGVMDQIWFYGASYDEAKNAELIYNADLCISPGNIGLTAIHSLMFGTPAITHSNFPYQMPEFESIKQGVTGDFFQENNSVSLAQCIENWFLNHVDREKARLACYHKIDNEWNPYYQIGIFKKVFAE